MRWSDLAPTIPHGATMATVQPWILEQVAAGHYYLLWRDLTIQRGEVTATFHVSSPLELGEPGDSVVPATSLRTAQRIADWLGAVLVTPQLMDHAAADWGFVDFQSFPGFGDTRDLSVARMVKVSAHVHAGLGEHGGPFVAGKQWPMIEWYANPKAAGLTGGVNTAVNYGGDTAAKAGRNGPWPSMTFPTSIRVWQPPGGRGSLWHDVDHVDYSQLSPMLVARDVDVVIGDESFVYDIAEIASDPELAFLMNTGGPLPLHHPALPVCAPLADGGGCGGPPDPHPGPGGGGHPGTPSPGPSLASLAPVLIAGSVLAVVVWLL